MEAECEELQIDLGAGSGADPRPAAEAQSGMTWLKAAEHVLRENGGPGMHIRDLTRTILELGIVREPFHPAFCYGGAFLARLALTRYFCFMCIAHYHTPKVLPKVPSSLLP